MLLAQMVLCGGPLIGELSGGSLGLHTGLQIGSCVVRLYHVEVLTLGLNALQRAGVRGVEKVFFPIEDVPCAVRNVVMNELRPYNRQTLV